MKSNFKAQGFYRGVRVAQKEANNPKMMRNSFNGFLADEVQVVATIRSREEMASFIEFLISAQPCLGTYKPKAQKDEN